MNNQLAGLEEKFRVLNNDELADALHDRIIKLSSRSERFIPEALSLLLQLSDQPIKYSRVEDLEFLKPKPQPPPTPLTWANILEDDPLDNQDGLWDDVDFAASDSDAGNSDKENWDKVTQIVLHDLNPSASKQEKNDQPADFDFDADRYELSHDNRILEDLVNAQCWGNRKNSEDYSPQSFAPKSAKLTEAQLKREVIFMLLGLPTPIWRQNSEGLSGLEFLEIETEHMSQEALKHLLGEFAALSDSLDKARAWVRRIETVELLQAFQAGLNSRMNIVERTLSDIQSRMLNPSSRSTASLLDLFSEVSILTRLIQKIVVILDYLQSLPTACIPIQLLERLYDFTCLTHIVDDRDCYTAMANLFFECFHVYLRPVRAWMKFGALSKHEKAFFIRENTHDVAADKLWQEQFQLIETEAGILQAPRFLHTAVKKIVTAGKSIDFLKRLGGFSPDEDPSPLQSHKLDFETMCRDNVDSLIPFSTIFDISLENWIADMYQPSSQRLREVLESKCRLKSSLDALEIVYFNRNGAVSSDIAKVIFERIDSSIEVWNDGFRLTELFQGVLSAYSSLDVDRLAVHSVGKSGQVLQDKRRSVKILEGFKVWYDLPWPVANIIKSESIQVYQHIFVILNQIQRAKNVLQRKHFMKSIVSSSESKNHDNRLAYGLRQCLLWFTNSLLAYLTNSVLWVECEEMRRLMTNAGDMDEMILVHEKFISRLENQCLISKKSAPIHQAVIAILDLSILFSDAHASYQAQRIINRPTTTTAGARAVPGKCTPKSSDKTSEPSWYDDDADSHAADLSYISFDETPYTERLKNMQASFNELVSFIITALNGIHEAGGEGQPGWGMLADSLAIGLGTDDELH